MTKRITAHSLYNGVFACPFLPFSTTGKPMITATVQQIRQIASIKGIKGIAIQTTFHGHTNLSDAERLEVVQRSRDFLSDEQMLLVSFEDLSQSASDSIHALKGAGADAIITPSPDGWKYNGSFEQDTAFNTYTNIVNGSALPVVLFPSAREGGQMPNPDFMTALASKSDQLIGFGVGADNDTARYDETYYSLKSLRRPIACLSSSDTTLFHNLNTGADGVLSQLALIAPHEVISMYRAAREGLFFDAQALHNQLAPLLALLNTKWGRLREQTYRVVAHHRGLLPSTLACGSPCTLSQATIQKIRSTIDLIDLKPIT